MSNVNIGNLPSWILVVLIGLGISVGVSNGMLSQYGGLGRTLVLVGLGLGGLYFILDLSNKF